MASRKSIKSRRGCKECKSRQVKYDGTHPVPKPWLRLPLCLPTPVHWQIETPEIFERTGAEPWTGAAQPDKDLCYMTVCPCITWPSGWKERAQDLSRKKNVCILNMVFTYYRTYSRTSSLWTRAKTLSVGYVDRTITIHLTKLKPLGAFRRCIPGRLCVAIRTVPNTPGLGCDD